MSPALLLMLPPAEARFDVLVKGKKAGIATYRLSDRPGGGRVTRLRVALADGSVSESLTATDAAGAAVRSEDVVRRGRGGSKQTVAYGPHGDATLVVDGGRPVLVPFHARGSRKDPSETWWRTAVPTPGTWAVFLALDTRKRTWDEVRVTYVGQRGLGNLVRQQRGSATTNFTLDARGIPLEIESRDLRMVRR